MNESSRNIAVGLTTLAGLAGLIVLMLMFGYLPEFFESGYRVTIKMPTAGGVQPGNRVLYQGLDAGEIRSIKQAPGLASGVEIVALVLDNKKMPEGTIVQVSRPALGGSPTVEFVPPEKDDEELTPLPTDGSAVIHGEVTSAFSQLADSLKSAVNDLMGELKGDDGALANIGKLAKTWDQLGQNLVELTNMQVTLDEVDDGQHDPTMETFLTRMDRTVKDLHTAVQGVNKYLEDEQLRENLTNTFDNANRISTDLAKWTGKLDKTTDNIDSSITELKSAYVNVADRLTVFLNNGNNLLESARDGNGTLGELLNNPQLYNNLDTAAKRLDAALKEAKLLIEKWKAEGVPIQL